MLTRAISRILFISTLSINVVAAESIAPFSVIKSSADYPVKCDSEKGFIANELNELRSYVELDAVGVTFRADNSYVHVVKNNDGDYDKDKSVVHIEGYIYGLTCDSITSDTKIPATYPKNAKYIWTYQTLKNFPEVSAKLYSHLNTFIDAQFSLTMNSNNKFYFKINVPIAKFFSGLDLQTILDGQELANKELTVDFKVTRQLPITKEAHTKMYYTYSILKAKNGISRLQFNP